MVKAFTSRRRDRVPLESGMLQSGLLVKTEFDPDDLEVIVSVGKDDVHFSRSVPIHGFPILGRPLAWRIRCAIMELDAYWLDNAHGRAGAEGQAQEAAHTALFAGGPVREGKYYTQQDPPLIMQWPDDPPSE